MSKLRLQVRKRWASFRKPSIKRRIGLGLVIILSLIVVNGVSSMLQAGAVSGSYYTIIRSHDLMETIVAVSSRNANLTVAAENYAYSANVAAKSSYQSTGKRVPENSLEQLDAASSSHAPVRELIGAAARLDAVEKQAFQLTDAGRQQDALALLHGDGYQTWQRYFNEVAEEIGTQQAVQVEVAEQAIDRAWSRMSIVYWLVVAGTALCCLLGTFVVANSLFLPIARLQRAARSLSRGNLDTRVEINSRDELGQLAIAFNTMAVALDEDSHQARKRLRKLTRELEDK